MNYLLRIIDKVHEYPCPYGIGGTAWVAIRSCIEKQIPKRIEEKRYIYTKCECGREFSVQHGDGYYSIPYENKTNYCPDCGQKLDWSDES